MNQDAINSRNELRQVLNRIKKSPAGTLEWVSKDAGVPLDKVLAFVGNDMTEPDDHALQDIEVHFLLDWYHFAGG
jgi:hypothetical protein